MPAITLGDVASFDVDASGLTLVCLPSATLGGSLFLRMEGSSLRNSMCRCFFVAVVGTVPLMDLRRSAAALIVRSASDIAGALQCAGYIFSTAVVMSWLSHM